jgi:predicted nuclease with RNAse H fold
MRTVGVDLSAEERNTWSATLDWRSGGARIVALEPAVGNARIVEATVGADKVGIDCPFGWPVPFVDFVAEHRNGAVAARTGLPIDWRRELAYRATDRFVIEHSGLRPLSVAADRIGHAAMRCAALLAELAAAGVSVDRSGVGGAVVEVYPAAALATWGLRFRGYKGAANLAILDELVTDLQVRAPWLQWGEFEPRCREVDDAFDAVIAALNARTVVLGLTLPPPADQQRLAEREGWIALPHTGSLARLPD